MKFYTIIGGVNGVGKSSFSGVLRSLTNDLGKIVDMNQHTDSAATRITDICIAQGVNLTQETTLSDHHTADTAKRAKDAGYSIRLFYIGLDTAEECKKRIANRVSRGGHNVDSEDVERRFAARREAVSKVLPFCDEASFYDNYNGFTEVAVYRNGELLLVGDYRPAWIVELKIYLEKIK